MNKTLHLFLLLMLSTFILNAQTPKTGSAKRVKGKRSSSNSIYIGILGPTIPGSLNYEYIWTKNEIFNFSAKIGGFYAQFPKLHELTVANGSFECNMIIGRSKHLFDMGIGWAGHYGSYFSDDDLKTKYYGVPTNTFSMHYRFQKPTGGLFFKVGFTGSTILFFGASDLKELAIGNAAIYGFEALNDKKPTFSLLSVGIGYSFRK